jgi:uncharacterized protein YkwD
LLGHYGLVEVTPIMSVVRAAGDPDSQILNQLPSELAELFKVSAIAQIGVGLHRPARDELVMVVALQEKNVELDDVPRAVPVGAAIRLTGRLQSTHGAPEVMVTGPDGQTQSRPVASDARRGGFQAQARCDRGPGRYQVEVFGTNALGPRVVANFPVFCGVPLPAQAPQATASRDQPWTGPDAETRLFELVNRDRRAAGLPPLALDGALSKVARAHSQDMADHRFVGHVSPTAGTALDRVRRAGIAPLLLMENIGSDVSPEQVHAGLMQSPGHRAAILDPQVTRIGIGVAIGMVLPGTSQLLVTQLFM